MLIRELGRIIFQNSNRIESNWIFKIEFRIESNHPEIWRIESNNPNRRIIRAPSNDHQFRCLTVIGFLKAKTVQGCYSEIFLIRSIQIPLMIMILLQILVYILVFLFVIDLFFRYRAYKSGGADATASNPTATAASGGEVPKY